VTRGGNRLRPARHAAGAAMLAVVTFTLSACASSPSDLHRRLLTLDAHLDTPVHFARPGWRFEDRHDSTEDLAQVDLPRMADGNLDGGFFVIFTDQGPLTADGYAAARAFAVRRSDEIDGTIARYADRIGAATTATDARRAADDGRLVAFKSLENSYPIGEDLALLAEFHRRGVRMAGPVHSKVNQFADSSTDEPRWNGLSPLGRRWVAEMNRLGLLIDASHASDAAFDQMLALSTTPLILSHTSPKALFDHPRNLDDARIRKLAAAGGAICVSTIYLSPINMTPARTKLFAEQDRLETLSVADQADFARRWRALDQTEPLWDADFERFMAALLHVIEVAGIDHVCIGADWDGGGGIAGFADISALPEVTARLIAAGYSDAAIAKLWSGNILRLLSRAQAAATAGRPASP
jgi:membrane dipeptidase